MARPEIPKTSKPQQDYVTRDIRQEHLAWLVVGVLRTLVVKTMNTASDRVDEDNTSNTII
jgi:hypothetical protein